MIDARRTLHAARQIVAAATSLRPNLGLGRSLFDNSKQPCKEPKVALTQSGANRQPTPSKRILSLRESRLRCENDMQYTQWDGKGTRRFICIQFDLIRLCRQRAKKRVAITFTAMFVVSFARVLTLAESESENLNITWFAIRPFLLLNGTSNSLAMWMPNVTTRVRCRRWDPLDPIKTGPLTERRLRCRQPIQIQSNGIVDTHTHTHKYVPACVPQSVRVCQWAY